MKSDIH